MGSIRRIKEFIDSLGFSMASSKDSIFKQVESYNKNEDCIDFLGFFSFLKCSVRVLYNKYEEI